MTVKQKDKELLPLRQRIWNARSSYVLMFPFLLLFLVFVVIPILSSVVLSFTSFNMLQMPKFVGFDNYIRMFLEDDIFVKEDEELLRGRIRWLVPSAQKNRMEPIMVEMAPGGETEEDDPHEGEEFGYVLSGSVKVIVGDRAERVRKDESFYFLPTAPHKLVNAGKTVCRVLWVSTPPSF